MDPRVAESVKAAASKFAELGATVEEVSIPRHKLAPSIWVAGMRLSSSLSLKGYQSGRRQLFLNDLQEKKFPLTQEKADDVSVRRYRKIGSGSGWGCLVGRRGANGVDLLCGAEPHHWRDVLLGDLWP
jgi:Asp-tRNA(Asn)/Glu-tRNA(Gln) amidotransferase A subunit family amidase